MRFLRTWKMLALVIVFFGSALFGVAVAPVSAQVTIPENPPTPAAERVRFQRQPLSMVPPGTRFGENPPKGWSNLISFARGQLTSGDVDSVTETVRYYGEIFNLVMLANADTPEAEGKFELDKVAVGFSMVIQGINTIVTSETQGDLGGGLSFLGRGVLDGNIDSLRDVQQVARTRNNIVIDAPAIVLRDGEHREMVVRYYIWVFPENGNIGTLVWLLDLVSKKTGPSSKNAGPAEEKTGLRVANTTIQLLPPNMQEIRVLNVDGDQFNILGIPSKDAFALVQIPQGIAFEMTKEMQALAAETTYTAESLKKLTGAIVMTLKTGKK